ncbi:hypothetical protein AYX15_06263 [Cryptococcus neoformans]|nr:hypothetical protein AYX15_06263 [Cryptococcus neoformans var. grubii]OXC70277.1 hypothetical protein AYX13_01187 [Cryptococcus neoformans var. grubii]OXG15010.1 hypothetical protein C367_05674 [Cryptococcus neoformans var. grubii Ze90-1]
MRPPALRTFGQLQLRQLNSSLRPLHSTPLLLTADNNKKSKTKFLTDRPVKVERTPAFPPPANPFAPKEEPVHYSDLTLGILWKINKLLGYNGRRRTTARESGRMMTGIIEAVKQDKVFWYEECDLPKTFHTFFSIHLVYLLITLIRLRALPNHIPNPLSPIPQSALPGQPGTTTPIQRPSLKDKFEDLVSSPHEYKYRQTLLTHFFNIVENEIRLMLGVEITRDSAVQTRMKDYANWWREAQLGMDYAIGLTASEDPQERAVADAELASWVWRLIFGRRGEGANGQGELVYPEGEGLKEGKELEMAEQVEVIVRFIRREMARLDKISDRDVIAGNVGMFGKVRE